MDIFYVIYSYLKLYDQQNLRLVCKTTNLKFVNINNIIINTINKLTGCKLGNDLLKIIKKYQKIRIIGKFIDNFFLTENNHILNIYIKYDVLDNTMFNQIDKQEHIIELFNIIDKQNIFISNINCSQIQIFNGYKYSDFSPKFYNENYNLNRYIFRYQNINGKSSDINIISVPNFSVTSLLFSDNQTILNYYDGSRIYYS